MTNDGQSSDLDSNNQLDRLFEEYLPKLIGLSAARISDRFKSKFDENDIAATVCRSVFRRWKEGKFKFDDDAEFWRLLVTIAKRKISNRVRYFKTSIHDIEREVSETAGAIVGAPEPGPAEAAAFEESLAILAGRLDDLERKVLTLRMEGRDYQEIADILGYSEKTIRRKIIVIRGHLAGLFDTMTVVADRKS